MTPAQESRFWQKVQKGDGCWTWTGAKLGRGYGQLRLGGKYVLAHRASFEHACGPIAPGMCVLHRCDNPPCVRPDHLFVGTNLDNTLDMRRKRRDAASVYPERWKANGKRFGKTKKLSNGEHNGRAKLTEERVLKIRQLSEVGMSNRALARSFLVSPNIIDRIMLIRLIHTDLEQ